MQPAPPHQPTPLTSQSKHFHFCLHNACRLLAPQVSQCNSEFLSWAYMYHACTVKQLLPNKDNKIVIIIITIVMIIIIIIIIINVTCNKYCSPQGQQFTCTDNLSFKLTAPSKAPNVTVEVFNSTAVIIKWMVSGNKLLYGQEIEYRARQRKVHCVKVVHVLQTQKADQMKELWP